MRNKKLVYFILLEIGPFFDDLKYQIIAGHTAIVTHLTGSSSQCVHSPDLCVGELLFCTMAAVM